MVFDLAGNVMKICCLERVIPKARIIELSNFYILMLKYISPKNEPMACYIILQAYGLWKD